MRIRLAQIKRETNGLLESFGLSKPPVPIHKIARGSGVRIVKVSGKDDISGFLYPGKRPVIGVNKDQAQVRQRFTIAHELGHLKLHEHRQVHVDREFRVRFRSGASSQGINRDEMEANRFAVELLMPLEFLRRDIEERDFALTDNEALWSLAKIYGVSAQAMAFRLNGLGIPIVEEE